MGRLSSSTPGIPRYLVRIPSILCDANRRDSEAPEIDKGLAAFRTRKRPSRFRCLPTQAATIEDGSQEMRQSLSTASKTPLNPMLRSSRRHLLKTGLKT